MTSYVFYNDGKVFSTTIIPVFEEHNFSSGRAFLLNNGMYCVIKSVLYDLQRDTAHVFVTIVNPRTWEIIGDEIIV